jgi:hypothetical protein
MPSRALGTTRLLAALVLGALGYWLLFVVGGNAAATLLRRIEYLSNMPGLSGFVLLILSPGLFLGFCFVVEWIRTGYQGDPVAETQAPSAGT